MYTLTPDTAKVFTTGRSQAIRLPKAYRFNTKEVLIERQGNAVILRPKLDKKAWWAEMEKILDGFDGMAPVERERAPLRDDIEPFKP